MHWRLYDYRGALAFLAYRIAHQTTLYQLQYMCFIDHGPHQHLLMDACDEDKHCLHVSIIASAGPCKLLT